LSAVAGSRAAVSSLVPVAASPDTYQPTPTDIARLKSSRLLVANGAGLEEWLAHTIAAAASPNLIRVVCTDGLPVAGGNPHLWMDPEFARVYVAKMRDGLIAADPAGADGYRARAAAYDRQLVALVARIREKIATIPPQNREMLVFHDAWSYYNKRFGLRTLGVIETSPGREPNPADLARLVDLAKTHHVRAVFTEPEYNPKLMQTLAKSAGISKIAVLYDDSLGVVPQVHDYVSMLDYDTDTIVAGLKG
ncbi:MAG: zinc ABC transporter substrate-binding protein, partial [Candidatus Eremiobacteraeota bacterium]|nr:zinc ABC transporter substrate-binding protein [Candidatus Eremiobacteraeota bacterium]